jgi:hypothetical protein
MRFLFLSILIIAPAQASAQRWVDEFKQGPFVFKSEFAIRRGPLTQALAQIKQELEQKLKLKVGNDPINVHLFNSRRSYQAYMRQHVPRAINRQALFVKGPQGSSVYAYKNKDFDTDIRHECTHALIHNSVQFIPLWMDEGLAEYFELKAGTRIRPDRLNTVRNAVRWAPLNRMRITLTRLEAMDDITDMGASEYRDSWAWIHFLMNDTRNNNAGRAALVAYLAEIQKGQPPGLFSTYLTRRLPQNETKLVQHFRTFR